MLLQPYLQRFNRNIQQPQISISLVYISTRSGSISSTQWPPIGEPILQSWAWLLRLNSFWHHKWTLVNITAVPGGNKPSHHIILHYRTYEYISMYFSGHDRVIKDTNSRVTFFRISWIEYVNARISFFQGFDKALKTPVKYVILKVQVYFPHSLLRCGGCKLGTTSVYFGITYACFIPKIFPVFACGLTNIDFF